MPQRKTPITELPDKEALAKLFPKPVIKRANAIAHEKDHKKPAEKGKKPKK